MEEFSLKLAVGTILLFAAMWCCTIKTESYIVNQVVRLEGNGHGCSGFQVTAPSGKRYVLTAGHCNGLIENGSILARSEDGKTERLKVVDESPVADILLLEPFPGLKGLDIGRKELRNMHIRTFTHGHGYNTYKTEGIIVQEEETPLPLFVVENEQQFLKCLVQPKTRPIMTPFGTMCALVAPDVVSTAIVVPGSSGGAVVDNSGDIVGLVSGTGGAEGFSFLVRLDDIKEFMKNR